MAQSLAKIILHVVFSTKGRKNTIPEQFRNELHAYIAGIIRSIGGEAYRVGGTNDHIHIACLLPRTLTVSKLLEDVKKSSSVWLKTKDSQCKFFSWQAGYGAFSVAQSQLDALVAYIDNQKEHHEKLSYEDEFVEVLKRYRVDYDDRYLWE